MYNSILWTGSILEEVKIPKSLSFTKKQIETVRAILDGDKCLSDDFRVFSKMVGRGFVIEYQEGRRYFYELSNEAIDVLENEIPERKKITMSEAKAKYGCGNCNGTGYIREYAHVAGGVCFACNGTGRRRR